MVRAAAVDRASGTAATPAVVWVGTVGGGAAAAARRLAAATAAARWLAAAAAAAATTSLSGWGCLGAALGGVSAGAVDARERFTPASPSSSALRLDPVESCVGGNGRASDGAEAEKLETDARAISAYSRYRASRLSACRHMQTCLIINIKS